MMNYVIMDTHAVRSSCEVRRATVNFIIWLYESTVAHEVATTKGATTMNDFVMYGAYFIDPVPSSHSFHGYRFFVYRMLHNSSLNGFLPYLSLSNAPSPLLAKLLAR